MDRKWQPIQHTQLTDQVYEAVRSRILSRAIKIDEQINVEEVAAELQVSRTPVVDAIKRLSADGLVEVRARKGTFVKGITEHDAIEIFQIREALELFAARHVIDSPKHHAVVARMQELLRQMSDFMSDGDFKNYVAFSAADNAFHNAMILACNNHRMARSYDTLNIHLHIMRSYFFKPLDPPKRVHSDHIDILEAVTAQDASAAQKAIQRHLDSIREKMIDNIRVNGGVL